MNTEFEKIIKKLSPVLKKIAYKAGRNYLSVDHEDLYQEALLHLWQDWTVGRLADKTDSYILQGCYFYLKNYLRKIKDSAGLISFEVLIDEESATLEDILSLGDKKTEAYFENLDNKIIVNKMRNNGLKPKEKKLLNFLAEGLTIREIGSKLGVSHVYVLKMKSAIRKKNNLAIL